MISVAFLPLLIKCMFGCLQSVINSLEADLSQAKDNNLHQKKRAMEMMMSLLKDLSDIGSVVGGNAADFKVNFFLKLHRCTYRIGHW